MHPPARTSRRRAGSLCLPRLSTVAWLLRVPAEIVAPSVLSPSPHISFLPRGRHGSAREAALRPSYASPATSPSPRTDLGPASSVRRCSASSASPPGRRTARSSGTRRRGVEAKRWRRALQSPSSAGGRRGTVSSTARDRAS
uniref:Uncharacterized protein n=1 Tax=Aegilops tauschii subsp. strangulata TaxID=200361 RepID=A0A452Z552_AEGTS